MKLGESRRDTEAARSFRGDRLQDALRMPPYSGHLGFARVMP
jgi:hypothetical protein